MRTFPRIDLLSLFLKANLLHPVFDVSNQLYGLKYTKRDDVPMYHPDVNLYEVRKSTGENGEDKLVALFIHDNFARSYKSSGAWMVSYCSLIPLSKASETDTYKLSIAERVQNPDEKPRGWR